MIGNVITRLIACIETPDDLSIRDKAELLEDAESLQTRLRQYDEAFKVVRDQTHNHLGETDVHETSGALLLDFVNLTHNLGVMLREE